MTDFANFQGVVCCCLDRDTTVQESLIRLLDLKTTSKIRDIECSNLELKNKYYQATIQVFDFQSIPTEGETRQVEVLKHCDAIIFYANGQTLSSETLDARLEQLKEVGGEPRILVCHSIDEECEAYKTLRDWCIQNSYDLMLTTEPDIKVQMIDSLSAYKWHLRSEPKAGGSEPVATGGDDRRELNDEMLKKLTDFDTLLNKLSAYRDRPELRGDPNDKNIGEIAEILTGLLGDDVDNFLENEELNETTNGEKNHHQD